MDCEGLFQSAAVSVRHCLDVLVSFCARVCACGSLAKTECFAMNTQRLWKQQPLTGSATGKIVFQARPVCG